MDQPDFEFDFEKLHGASNDFIFIPHPILINFKSQLELKNFVKNICHRNQGIGADGVVFYDLGKDKSKNKSNENLNQIKIFIVNSDGSYAGTCGNALRCLGFKLLRDKEWDGKTELPIYRLFPKHFSQNLNLISSDESFVLQTNSFAILNNATLDSVITATVHVAMGKEVNTKATPILENALAQFGNTLDFLTPIYVELSNPHWIFISPNFQHFNRREFKEFGLFAQGELRSKSLEGEVPLANIGMITLQQKNSLQWNLVVFERGAGLTQCCGSGAVAARIALEYSGFVSQEVSDVSFQMPGGLVSISKPLNRGDETAQRVLKGPAHWVFKGNGLHRPNQ
ncbi:diaminopimelate epimerase [Silvanigrella aquatica]|uniref:Diaminopimelate epimerase n=1 Tax=Silvanigrella aquatica TaxID=1915309 RepID=A0A1L4D152_9BACT|nr:diaminopimelate epimerase [Silvanigrella aquatica]APJ03914.1 diaminopimelate epimerase [Silvanigrella aquatica]